MPIADKDGFDFGFARGFGKTGGSFFRGKPSDKNEVSRCGIGFGTQIFGVNRVGNNVCLNRWRQIGLDDISLELRKQNDVREQAWQGGDVFHHARACCAPQFVGIAALVTIRYPTLGGERCQRTDMVLRIVVEAAVGAKEEIFMHCINGR